MAFDILDRKGRDPSARPPDGLRAWTQVIERGHEGYVAKDEASAYEGGPTRRYRPPSEKAGGERGRNEEQHRGDDAPNATSPSSK